MVKIENQTKIKKSQGALRFRVSLTFLSLVFVSTCLKANEVEQPTAEAKQTKTDSKPKMDPIWHAMVGLASYNYLEMGSLSSSPANELLTSIYLFSVGLATDRSMKQAWDSYRHRYPWPMDDIIDPNWMIRPEQVGVDSRAKGEELINLLDRSAQAQSQDQVVKLFSDLNVLTYNPFELANRDNRYIPAAIYVGFIKEWLALRPAHEPLAQEIAAYMNEKFSGPAARYEDLRRMITSHFPAKK